MKLGADNFLQEIDKERPQVTIIVHIYEEVGTVICTEKYASCYIADALSFHPIFSSCVSMLGGGGMLGVFGHYKCDN